MALSTCRSVVALRRHRSDRAGATAGSVSLVFSPVVRPAASPAPRRGCYGPGLVLATDAHADVRSGQRLAPKAHEHQSPPPLESLK